MILSNEQTLAIEKFNNGENLFITGPGGTGKTFLINEIIKQSGKKIQVCALTGCAAILLQCNARTIHSWSGIKLANGEFILFIDADDELLKNSIEWRQEIFESLGKDYASIYCSKIEYFKNKSKAEEQVLETNGRLNVSLVGRGNNGIPGQITNHLFRKDVLIEVNGYNESLKFNEDFELILRIAKTWLFFGVNRAGFIQHIREDSWSNSDPYIAYAGVEAFLQTSLDEKLLPVIEINKRSKENRLSLVKKLLYQKYKWSEVSPYIDEAFVIAAPLNLKEYVLFFLNKIIKIGKEN